MFNSGEHAPKDQDSPALTRRQAGSRIFEAAALLALAGVVAPTAAALGQPKQGSKGGPAAPTPGTKAAAPPASAGGKSFLEGVLRKGTTNDWVLKVSIHLDSYQSVSRSTPDTKSPGAGTPGAQGPVTIIPFDFQTAAVVFPAMLKTATSEQGASGVSAQLRCDARTISGQPTWLEGLPSGARYGRWDMTDVKGRAIDFEVEMRLKTWEVQFNEAVANKATWPASGKWPSEAQSALGVQMGVEPASALVQGALAKWCAGKPPKGIPPVQLAKFLASRVLETIQPSGDGLVSSKTGLLQGFYLKGQEATLRDGRGSEHDISALLCAVYRAAGLPARTVIGYDATETLGLDVGLARQTGGSVRSWVEFCLVDETVKLSTGEPASVWVPVDIVRQRKTSSRPPPLDKPWRYFGSNEETDEVMPIAFHFHPPLSGVIAHGSPCLWGWMTTPEMQTAEQSIRFLASTPSRTAPDKSGRK